MSRQQEFTNAGTVKPPTRRINLQWHGRRDNGHYSLLAWLPASQAPDAFAKKIDTAAPLFETLDLLRQDPSVQSYLTFSQGSIDKAPGMRLLNFTDGVPQFNPDKLGDFYKAAGPVDTPQPRDQQFLWQDNFTESGVYFQYSASLRDDGSYNTLEIQTLLKAADTPMKAFEAAALAKSAPVRLFIEAFYYTQGADYDTVYTVHDNLGRTPGAVAFENGLLCAEKSGFMSGVSIDDCNRRLEKAMTPEEAKKFSLKEWHSAHTRNNPKPRAQATLIP